ncbi:hypothetical protein C1645_822595 [Glomus cerebriforme]|uniref:Uncharacterized protein n=1 Tax=Glomus cerebriforme TaxID=658196 RepID=A0A397T7D8_9GLOM|nr:hypothetical protein C1645_822595 [Glomus cerebriforme]
MSDIYKDLERIKALYEKEKYEKNRKRYQIDPSCLECYKVKEGTEPEWFKKFWRIFQKVILKAMDYNRNTIEKLARRDKKNWKELWKKEKSY